LPLLFAPLHTLFHSTVWKKSSAASLLYKVARHLTAGNPKAIFDYLLLKSRVGKKLYPHLSDVSKAEHVLKNIKNMHSSSSVKYKSSILSLVAGVYSRAQLQSADWQFSTTQYKTATRKARDQSFSLSDYRRSVPPSRAASSAEIKTLVVEFLEKHSRISSATASRRILRNSSPSSSIAIPVYYLEKPKKDIFADLKMQHPNLKLSLSSFYKLCPRNFKKSAKMTDMCRVCVAGKAAEEKLQKIRSAPAAELAPTADITKTKLEDEISFYRRHVQFKEQQQKYYERSVERTTNSSCVVVMDFKQNFKIGGGPVETGSNFFEKTQVSVLGFAVR
jgi:hypothetical protein